MIHGIWLRVGKLPMRPAGSEQGTMWHLVTCTGFVFGWLLWILSFAPRRGLVLVDTSRSPRVLIETSTREKV